MLPRWPVPVWPTVTDLATALRLDAGTLDWLADRRGQARRAAPKLRHYHTRWVPKAAGGWRLLEVPKQRLAALQRRLLHEVLDAVPPRAAAVAFRPGGSVLAHASAYSGARTVLRMDLEDFFLTTRAARVTGVFRAAGYPAEVARTLAALCTTVTADSARWPPGRAAASAAPVSAAAGATPDPAHAASEAARTAPDLARTAPDPARARTAARLAGRHLPQGAPTSPALANLCAWRLDVRLSALAAAAGARYTRYADDLAFSGDLSPAAARRLAVRVAAVALEEGYAVNHRKTRVMPASTRQVVTGLVVNAHPNVPRAEYDRLKAILHGYARALPTDRPLDALRAHLAGRVAWVRQVNPRRAARLQALFDRIAWPG